MNSLRRTITTRAALMLAVVGVFAAASSFGLVTYEMNKFLDAQLQEIAINVGPGDRSEAGPLLESEDEDQLVVRVWDRSGGLVHRSGPDVDIAWQPRQGLSDVTAEGQHWRVYRWSHAQHDIQIAQAWSARREIAAHAATGAALPLLLAIPLAWAVMSWSIRHTMSGLQRLSADIGHRSVDAREPLSAADVPVEVAPLIEAIDKLVERQRAALDAQRRFVADAAHELRTPLAALQIQVENLLSSELAGEARTLASELDGGVRRTSHLAAQLLEMARTEGAALRDRSAVDLQTIASEMLAEFYTLADARGVELAMSVDQPTTVEADPEAVRKLISILLDNAIGYSPPGKPVEIRIAANASERWIEVVDEGPGISEQAMPFIYDRFFRAAPPGVEGTGLGLAIAKSTADRNGLFLSHRNRAGKAGLIARIAFVQGVAKAS
jgi:two-component system, OmpR family, sensor kinase